MGGAGLGWVWVVVGAGTVGVWLQGCGCGWFVMELGIVVWVGPAGAVFVVAVGLYGVKQYPKANCLTLYSYSSSKAVFTLLMAATLFGRRQRMVWMHTNWVSCKILTFTSKHMTPSPT